MTKLPGHYLDLWRSMSPLGRLAAVVGIALATQYGGSKGFLGRISVSDPYIADAGSYLTNDVVHVAISKRSTFLPDDTDILVYARAWDSTNAADWVRLTPHLTYADHPHDYALADATNHNVLVAASYVPVIVHTNGVWSITGFLIPGGGGKIGFKNTHIDIRKDEE